MGIGPEEGQSVVGVWGSEGLTGGTLEKSILGPHQGVNALFLHIKCCGPRLGGTGRTQYRRSALGKKGKPLGNEGSPEVERGFMGYEDGVKKSKLV